MGSDWGYSQALAPVEGWRLGEGHIPASSFSSQNFIKAKQYPPSTQVELQNDGAESAVFQQLFQKWTVPNRTTGLGKTHTVVHVYFWTCPLRTHGNNRLRMTDQARA